MNKRHLGSAVAAAVAAVLAVSAAGATRSDVAATIKAAGFPGPVGVAYGAVWVGGHRNGVIYRIDPATNKVAAKVEVPDTLCDGLTFGPGSMWWPNCGEGGRYVYRIDPHRMRVVGRLEGFAPQFGAGSLWVSEGGPDNGQAIRRIDPRTGRTTARVTSLGFDKREVFLVVGVAFDSVWVWSETGVIVRISTRTNRVTAVIPAPGSKRSGAFPGGYLFGGGFAVASGAAWLTNPAGVYRIDPVSNSATLVKLPLRPFTQYGGIYVAAGANALWIRTGDRTVVRLDPETRKIVAHYPAAGGGGGIGYGFGSLWVANAFVDSVWRIRVDRG